ncbi:MAG: hypothetical protein Phog2KO_26260 [Phototrophicaceae bacterium]
MPIVLHQLAKHLGRKSLIAQKIVPELYSALETTMPQFEAWFTDFSATAPKKLKTDKIATHYALDEHNPTQLVFVLRSYYALLIKILAGTRLAPIETIHDIENGHHFREHGIKNFTEGDVYNWYLGLVDVSELISLTQKIDFTKPVPDALKALYHDLFPRELRHTLGEYYTPNWLANFVLNRVDYSGKKTLLDPACGSGTFLTLAYHRLLEQDVSEPLSKIAGIDVNPLACLSAKANLVLNIRNFEEETILPIYCADTLLNPPDIGEFDLIIGNPPWVNWETLPEDYRQETKSLWEHYGLFPHTGFDTILGKGKKDISLLLTYAVIDHYLSKTGTLAFIMTQSVLKTTGAGEGFRRFDFGDKVIKPSHVDDFSKLRVFSGAETKPIVLILSHDAPAETSYYLWQSSGKQTIKDNAPDDIIDSLSYSKFIAEPIDTPESAWLTGKKSALSAVRKIVGKSDYTAHAGVYTGGANSVYWLDILDKKDDLLLIRNIIEGSKRPVKQVETWLEAEFIYPFLRGRDVSKWHAEPSAHILVVQDPEKRQGYDEDWLQENYPLTYTYLAQFEANLKQRATYRRYFRDNVPFYTMFDIGHYTFAPYKVVWHGFGKKRMEAVVIGSINKKPIMSNQAMHPFIGLYDENEAHFLTACLNSSSFEFAVISHTQSGGKSFAQPGILERLRLPQYDADNAHHQQLVTLSKQAHQANIDAMAIDQASANIWDLSSAELQELQDSLAKLVT